MLKGVYLVCMAQATIDSLATASSKSDEMSRREHTNLWEYLLVTRFDFSILDPSDEFP